MSDVLTEIEEGKVYQGYDALAGVQFCTPSVLGCSACLGASVIDGYVALSVSVNTPFGNVSKTFKVTNNISFTWQPFSRFKVTISVTNFSSAGSSFSFDASVQLCVDVPFLGWKCYTYTHHFSIPTALAVENETELNDYQVATLFGIHSSVGEGAKDCGCDDKSKFLQGDIYSGYLNQQAGVQGGFPTIPVVSCVVTCTGIPIVCSGAQAAAAPQANVQGGFPTIPVVSCVAMCTAVPPFCGTGPQANAQANVQGGFPTVPVYSCVVTCTGIPIVCSGAQAQAATAPQANAQGGFPTVPVYSCVVTCTGIPIVCSSAQAQAAAVPQANVQGGFPTIPVVSCVVTCTGIPIVCSGAPQAQAAANTTTAFPTVPVTSCIPQLCSTALPQLCPQVTGISPICLASHNAGTHANVHAAGGQLGFPTIPVVSCAVTCTGIPPIC